jgi:hypothetical protein
MTPGKQRPARDPRRDAVKNIAPVHLAGAQKPGRVGADGRSRRRPDAARRHVAQKAFAQGRVRLPAIMPHAPRCWVMVNQVVPHAPVMISVNARWKAEPTA